MTSTSASTAPGKNPTSAMLPIASGSAEAGSPPAPTAIDSATTSPVGTRSIRAASGPGPGRSRGQRPSSPGASTLAPPPHLRHCTHLWSKMGPNLQREMQKNSFNNVEHGLREAKTAAAHHATELTDAEHGQRHGVLYSDKCSRPGRFCRRRQDGNHHPVGPPSRERGTPRFSGALASIALRRSQRPSNRLQNPP